MLIYQGTRQYPVSKAFGRIPAQVAEGHHFQDYHGNRNIYIRHLEKDSYHLAIFVRGIQTTDSEMTWNSMQSYLINHFQFTLTKNYLKVIK